MTSTEIVTIIGAIGVLVTTVFTALATLKTKTEVNTVKQQGNDRDKKIDNITVLVDGRYGEVLQELANVRMIVAKLTGLISDHTIADTAQVTADEQHTRTASATAAIAAGGSIKLPDGLKT